MKWKGNEPLLVSTQQLFNVLNVSFPTLIVSDKPDKSLTVHAMKDKVDLTNIVQPENVVSQKIRTLAERLQDINQPSDRWD